VCAKERSHGSARGAPGNRRPYRNSMVRVQSPIILSDDVKRVPSKGNPS